jgi:hypothetical protein
VNPVPLVGDRVEIRQLDVTGKAVCGVAVGVVEDDGLTGPAVGAGLGAVACVPLVGELRQFGGFERAAGQGGVVVVRGRHADLPSAVGVTGVADKAHGQVRRRNPP